MKRYTKIKTFYTPKQVCRKDFEDKSTSKSPLKPLLLMNYLNENGFSGIIETFPDFQPFRKADFLIAHTRDYVNDFFERGPLSEMNSLPWSRELVDSVCYTNSSLYHAIRYACVQPETLTFSPTSGFHHAMPDSGSGFCTFSGQVIASLKLYRERGLVGAYLDLDGHFGNSIPISASFFPEVNEAIKMNINPKFSHQEYLEDLAQELTTLFNLIRKGKVDYVVWCHGADSHEWDDLGYQCSTEEWFRASEMFYTGISDLEEELGRCIPVTLSLFGGYRRDDYESVLSLHASDLRIASKILLNESIEYKTRVLPRIIRTNFLSLDNESSSSEVARA